MSEATGGGTVPLERRVLTLWRIRLVPVALVAGVGTAVLVGAAADAVPAAVLAGVVALAVAAGSVAWWTHLVWRSWAFRVGDEALELRHGVFVRRISTIPLHRVQHVDLESGPLERRLDLASLVLRTAAATSDAHVPGLDRADADVLRLQILDRVGAGDAV